MNIKKIIKEELDDFGWVKEIPDYYSFINKAFYFDPIAYGGDLEYTKLVEHIKVLDFEPSYSTPTVLERGDAAIGLFCYIDKLYNSLKYVYTDNTGDDGLINIDGEESYLVHITEFANSEAKLIKDEKIEIIYARNFIKHI